MSSCSFCGADLRIVGGFSKKIKGRQAKLCHVCYNNHEWYVSIKWGAIIVLSAVALFVFAGIILG